MDALDHLQNDSVLQPDSAEAEVSAMNQNGTLNSTLSESFVKMLDDPSLVADDLEENVAPNEHSDTNIPAKGMKPVQPNLSGNAPAKNDGEEVKNVENLKETLYSLDLFLHEIAYEKPDSFPDSNLRVIFKFLDFPPVRISPTIEKQQNVAGDAGSAVSQASKEGRTKLKCVVNIGKSCLFRSSYANLKARCSKVPLYIMLMQEDEGSGVDHFLGSAAVNIYQYIDSIESGYLNIPLKNDGYVTGTYAMYSLIGHETSKITISLRVKDFGVHMLNHFMCIHDGRRHQLNTMIENQTSHSKAATPSRHIVRVSSSLDSSGMLRASRQSQVSSTIAGEDDSNEFEVEDRSTSTNPTSEQWEMGKDEYEEVKNEQDSVDVPVDRDTLVERALYLMKPRPGDVSTTRGKAQDVFESTSSHHSTALPSGLDMELPPALVYTHVGPESDEDDDGNAEPVTKTVKPVVAEVPSLEMGPLQSGSSGLKIKSKRPSGTRSSRVSPRNAQSIRRLSGDRSSPKNVSTRQVSRSPRQRQDKYSDGRLSAADRRKREKQLREMWSGKIKEGRAYDGNTSSTSMSRD